MTFQNSIQTEEIILLTEVVSEDKQAPPDDSEDLMPVTVFDDLMAQAGLV